MGAGAGCNGLRDTGNVHGRTSAAATKLWKPLIGAIRKHSKDNRNNRRKCGNTDLPTEIYFPLVHSLVSVLLTCCFGRLRFNPLIYLFKNRSHLAAEFPDSCRKTRFSKQIANGNEFDKIPTKIKPRVHRSVVIHNNLIRFAEGHRMGEPSEGNQK